MATTVSGNDQFVINPVMSSEELRAAALSASLRRGKPVARRRVAMRWLGWLLWGWLLPVIGLLTVCAVAVTLAAMQYFGQSVVLDTAQTWATEQLGYTKHNYPQKPTLEATPYDNNPLPSVIPQLQIDRNYSSREQSMPSSPAADTPTSPSKQPGAQP